jgi:DNA-binding transcriptional MerR regulator
VQDADELELPTCLSVGRPASKCAVAPTVALQSRQKTGLSRCSPSQPVKFEYVAVDTDSAEVGRIRNFYASLGQGRISRQKVDAGVKLLDELQKQGFSLADIDVGLEWILQNKEKLGGAVYSVRLLPEVIGQALAGKMQDKKREVRTQQKRLEDQQRDEEEVKRRHLTMIYQLLPMDKQEVMRVTAKENLLRQGLKEEFLLEPLVRSEVLRLVAVDAGEMEG